MRDDQSDELSEEELPRDGEDATGSLEDQTVNLPAEDALDGLQSSGEDTAPDDMPADASSVLNELDQALNRSTGNSGEDPGADETSGALDASASSNTADMPVSPSAPSGVEQAAPRTSGYKLDFGPRRLPPPSPFMQLVMGISASRSAAPAEAEPWITPPPPDLEAAREQPRFENARGQSEAAPAAISVTVEVSLTEDALRRVAQASARENAATTQRQIEIVAKRLFDLDQEIFAREAHRRAIYRY